MLEHDDIAEAAIVGLPDDTKGHVPLALMVLKSGQLCVTGQCPVNGDVKLNLTFQ